MYLGAYYNRYKHNNIVPFSRQLIFSFEISHGYRRTKNGILFAKYKVNKVTKYTYICKYIIILVPKFCTIMVIVISDIILQYNKFCRNKTKIIVAQLIIISVFHSRSGRTRVCDLK